jgi:hypothetical protein
VARASPPGPTTPEPLEFLQLADPQRANALPRINTFEAAVDLSGPAGRSPGVAYRGHAQSGGTRVSHRPVPPGSSASSWASTS